MKRAAKARRILVLHGPNLQLLGTREPQLYGTVTLSQINAGLQAIARSRKACLRIVQSNYEGKLVELIGASRGRFDGILINPAGYTHTSVAIRDAIAACAVPCVEVHLSNIHTREGFRHTSLISPVAKGTVMGFGKHSYYLGLQALLDLL